ncbi:MAG: guanylate kinase [Micropruina sp.]|uniref:guanylate kinase n=1 Tax=Micropruina sp. TaxID=2737536 RepID=UPI0039E53472
MSGDVTVISGPTAVGKGTVVRALKERHPEVWVSVSATTRAPRPGEVDGQHYWFLSNAAFDELLAADDLLEWAVVHGRDRYGTPAGAVLGAMDRGERVILEIDLQGARQVRARLPQARLVFIAPPDWDELVARLVGRGTENAEQRERRLHTARGELAAADEFDHIVVNDDVGRAVDELVDLLGL